MNFYSSPSSPHSIQPWVLRDWRRPITVQSSSTALAFQWLAPCARTCFFIDAQTTTIFYLKIQISNYTSTAFQNSKCSSVHSIQPYLSNFTMLWALHSQNRSMVVFTSEKQMDYHFQFKSHETNFTEEKGQQFAFFLFQINIFLSPPKISEIHISLRIKLPSDYLQLRKTAFQSSPIQQLLTFDLSI